MSLWIGFGKIEFFEFQFQKTLLSGTCEREREVVWVVEKERTQNMPIGSCPNELPSEVTEAEACLLLILLLPLFSMISVFSKCRSVGRVISKLRSGLGDPLTSSLWTWGILTSLVSVAGSSMKDEEDSF
mmetsp:Transcript_26893/g.31722  ORF Transcript_26893/g.31722 Transcript_26893/m.31722 type:complete len:129 (+) Transcript_26893:106-492(+)